MKYIPIAIGNPIANVNRIAKTAYTAYTIGVAIP
jgi:hypothetical protein